MAAQDVREFVPRIRRAIEGPIPASSADALSDGQVEALAADCIADIILLTAGAWGHKLQASEVNPDTNVPLHWAVDPGLEFEEQSIVASQAALVYVCNLMKDRKSSERIRNEASEWEWSISANVLRDWLASIKEQRDAALAAVQRTHPALARYASFLEVRDPLMAAVMEPYVYDGGLGGGLYLAP